MGKNWNRDTRLTGFVASTSADDAYRLSHAPKFNNAEQYIKAKLAMLMDTRGFGIKVKETEIKHLYDIAMESKIKNWSDRKTEETINRAVRQIINSHWG
jgi:UDP-N-acetylglucosamine pyrophosphorylase